MLIETAWSYRYPPRVSSGKTDIVFRQPKPVRDIAWKAQVHLCDEQFADYDLVCRAEKLLVTVYLMKVDLDELEAHGVLGKNPALPCPGRPVK
jgi:hypothetical protein